MANLNISYGVKRYGERKTQGYIGRAKAYYRKARPNYNRAFGNYRQS
jgi:hypothetical protein